MDNTPNQPTENQPSEPQDAEVKSAEMSEELQEFVNKIFELARTPSEEAAATLGAYVDNGVNVNLKNQDGNTLLMLAAYNGATEVLAALIERGGDVDMLNDRYQSPLAGAIFKKEDGSVDLLIEAGANPQAGHPSAIECAQMFERTDLLPRLGVQE